MRLRHSAPCPPLKASLFVALTWLLGGSVLALMPAPASGQPDPRGRSVMGGVYVRDSGLANERLELAKRMEGLKEWHKSVDFYQELLEKYPDRVVAIAFDSKQQPTKYASVSAVAQDRLSHWPPEGLAVYRARYDLPAAALLEQTQRDDLAGLHKILNQYPVTAAAVGAGVRLLDMYIERGDFAAAARLGQGLLTNHPTLDAEKPAILFRTGLACAFAGDKPGVDQCLEQLRATYPDQRGVVGGAQVNLSQTLADLANRGSLTNRKGDGGESWTTFSGDVTRRGVGGSTGRPAARLYGMNLPPSPLSEVNESQKQQVADILQASRAVGLDLGIMPVLDRGQVFFHDGQRLAALNLRNGAPLEEWLASYPRTQGQFLVAPTNNNELINAILNLGDPWIKLQLATPRQYSLTVADDAVLAVMGQFDLRQLAGGISDRMTAGGGSRLVCLQRDTGQKRWTADPSTLPRNNGNVRNVVFSGAPLVAEGNVYITTRGIDAGSEDCGIACYDLAGGQLKWMCPVASSPSAPVTLDGLPVAIPGASLSHLAYASGRVFVLTNLGVVGAVDAYSGAPAWLSVYPRGDSAARAAVISRDGEGDRATEFSQLIKPWEFNAVVVADGKVFALPLDGPQLLVFDAGTGQVIQQIDRKFARQGDKGQSVGIELTMLLAVVDHKLIVGDNGCLLCLDWTQYDQRRAGPGKLDEAATLGFEPCPARIMGRPFVGRDSVIVPLQGMLWIIDLAKFKPLDRYPQNGGQWPDEEGPGNVVAADGQVIVARSRGVNVYTDLPGATIRYQTAIAANPRQIDARLDFSAMLFHAGKLDQSLTLVDQAIELLGGPAALSGNPAADQIYDHCLKLALRLTSSRVDADIATAQRFFDRAATAAHTLSQQVGIRILRARFLEQLKSPSIADSQQAAWLYQEILADRSMRLLVVAGDQKQPWRPAGDLAEKAIAALVARRGQQIAASLSAQAAAKLQQAGPAARGDDLMEVADAFPNSPDTADAALRQAAAAYDKANQPRLAAMALRRLYANLPPQRSTERSQLSEQLARACLKAGDTESALSWLITLNGDAPVQATFLTASNQPLLGEDSRPPQTFAQATLALRRLVWTETTFALPDVKLPLPLTVAQKAAGIVRLASDFRVPNQPLVQHVDGILSPPKGMDRPQSTDRLLTSAGLQIHCYAAGQPTPLWTSTLAQTPLHACWLDQKVLVWSEGEMALLDGGSGKPIWNIAATTWPAADMLNLPPGQLPPSAPGDEIAEDPKRLASDEPEDAPPQVIQQLRAARFRRGVPNVASPNPKTAAIPANDEDGRQRITWVCPQSDRTILATSSGRVAALDNPTGKSLWQIRLSPGPAITRLVCNGDLAVVYLLEDSRGELAALDLASGKLIWRTRFSIATPATPLNVALAADGTLVWTSQLSMVARDLARGGQRLWEQPLPREMLHSALAQSDQLLIARQQVLALVTDAGKRQVLIRRNLTAGQLLGKPIDLGLASADIAPGMQLLGARLYALGGERLISMHLNDDASLVPSPLDGAMTRHAAELMITRDFVLLPGRITDGSGRYLIDAYSRLLVGRAPGNAARESGLLAHKVPLTPRSPILAWQALDGGVYYLDSNKSLYWLGGTAK